MEHVKALPSTFKSRSSKDGSPPLANNEWSGFETRDEMNIDTRDDEFGVEEWKNEESEFDSLEMEANPLRM